MKRKTWSFVVSFNKLTRFYTIMQTPPPLSHGSGFFFHVKNIILAVAPFLVKSIIFVVMVLFLFGTIIGMSTILKAKAPSEIKVVNLSKRYEKNLKKVNDTLGQKYTPSPVAGDKKVFVLTFTGDVAASALEGLRKEISILLETASPDDEIIVCLESGGGFVHAYGLGSAELSRIKEAGIPLTIVVDKVAASGGYMMACVADTLIAAPFSIIGSIGVVAEFPNFSGWMSEHGITYEQYTAGKYKRTVSPFTKPTKEATKKTAEDLARTHKLFKDLVVTNRPEIGIDTIATGEIWYGQEALDLHLIDRVSTSDELIISRMSGATVYQLTYIPETKLTERFAEAASILTEKLYLRMSAAYLNNW